MARRRVAALPALADEPPGGPIPGLLSGGNARHPRKQSRSEAAATTCTPAGRWPVQPRQRADGHAREPEIVVDSAPEAPVRVAERYAPPAAPVLRRGSRSAARPPNWSRF